MYCKAKIMKKEQTTYTFAAREQNGYQAKEKGQQTFKPQNYAGGFFLPLLNALKGLIPIFFYSLKNLLPLGRFSTPVTVFQFLVLLLGTWAIFTMDLEDNGGFTREVSKAGFLQLADRDISSELYTPSSNSSIEFNEDDVNALIHRFRKVAMDENRKFNIPASVLLSIAILESRAGQAEKVKAANNFFGSKMGDKHYITAWENWRAHSIYLYNSAKGNIGNVNDKDEWIYFIAKKEEGNANLYAWQLKTLIAEYNLQSLD